MVTISTPAGGVTALSNLFINIQNFSRHNTPYNNKLEFQPTQVGFVCIAPDF